MSDRSDPGGGAPILRAGPLTGDRPPYLATTVALLAVIAVSQAIPWAQHAFGGNVPPLFARLSPSGGPWLVLAVALVGSAWFVVPRLLRARLGIFLAGTVAFGWVIAVALAIQAHGFDALSAPLRNPLDYQASVPVLRSLGVRAFVERYPDLTAQLSLHARTHPPGAVVSLWVFGRLLGGNLTWVAMVVAFVGTLGAIPTYALAREVYGVGPGRLAAMLFASAPGVLLFSATSLDAVFMTVAAFALMALVRAPRSGPWAFAAGVLTALALFFTFGVLTFALVGIGIGIVAWRGDARLSRPAGSAGTAGTHAALGPLLARAGIGVAGLLVGLLVLRLAIGFDPVAVFRSTLHAHLGDPSRARAYGYWVFADIPAFLIMAGFPQTALFVAEVRAAWTRPRSIGLETVLVATLVIASLSGVFLGEVDHIWLFFLPLLAASAGAALARSDGTDGARVPVVAAFTQALLMEVLLYTFW